MLGPAPRRDVEYRERAGPMIKNKPWALLLIKYLWILHPGAEQDQAAPVDLDCGPVWFGFGLGSRPAGLVRG